MPRPFGSKNKPKSVTVDGAEPTTVTTKKAPIKMDYDRQAALEEESDMLHIPKEIIPDGMRYNWKTFSILGQQQNRRFGRFEATGWEAVPASRHPGLFTPRGYEGNIEYDGLVLMEKPEELCRQTEAREFRKAREQVQSKEQQLRGGEAMRATAFANTQHQSAMRANRVSKTYERIDVPED